MTACNRRAALRHSILRLLCLLLCTALLASLTAPHASRAEQSRMQTIDVRFQTFLSDEEKCWAFPFDDSLFLPDASAYSHPLARASLGLALASGRSSQEPQDASIRDFLTQAGFEDLESADYSIPPGKDTIATMIGRKQLPTGETLLAVGVSGMDYGSEWLSNLDVGSGGDHRGFSSAAVKVSQRIRSYLQKHAVSGPCKLWISGFSRSAAVANLAAADLIEDGVFTTRNAYVYTFATPRTTQNPAAYPNLFNIIGKFDPATKLPYAEWGYGRHGTDLYTPAQETDSDYRRKHASASAVHEQLHGSPYINSTEINHNFTIIAEYLTSIIPSAAYYDQHMHEHLEEVWKHPNLASLRSLIQTLSFPVELSELSDLETHGQVEDLIDYLCGIIYGITSDILIDKEERSSAVDVLLAEHRPEVYIAWLFSSDDPSDVYSDQMEYVHLILDGKANVTLFDQKGGFILCAEPDGTCSQETDLPRYLRRLRPLEDRPLIDVYGEERRMMVLPRDQGMPFVIDALAEDSFAYYGVEYHVERCNPTVSRISILNMEQGEQYLAFSFTDEGAQRMNADATVWGDAHVTARLAEEGILLSAALNPELEGFEDVSISLKTILIVLLVILLVLLLLTVLLIIWLARLIARCIRRCRQRRQTAAAQE